MQHSFIDILYKQFAMKYLGDLHYFLGLHVVYSPSGIFLMQQKYVHDLLYKFLFQTVKPVTTPSADPTTLSLCDGDLLTDPSHYWSMVVPHSI